MIETIFIAISLGIILAFTIGPVFFILIETSITKGARSALAFDLGAILGDVFFIALAYWGTSKLSVVGGSIISEKFKVKSEKQR